MPITPVERRISMRDGTKLVLSVWSPSEPPRGTVVIVHGLGEHGGRYRDLAHELTGFGWEVHAADQRGHGRTSGPRGVIPTAEAIRDDVIESLGFARGMNRGPVVLLGHSMGGAFAAWAAAHAPDAADALVLSSPALRADLSAFQRVLMGTMLRLSPNTAVSNGLKVKYISHDAAVVEAYQNDPLVHDRVSSRLAKAIMTAGEEARQAAPHWRVPTLLLYAGDDRLVNPAGSQDFATTAPASMVTAQRFDGFYHELFNEVQRATPIRQLTDWLGARFPV